MSNLLVKIIGFPATLIHGDALVLDRWIWLKKRLYRTKNNESLLDVGCGSGAFTIGAALRGYQSLGLSWDERNQGIATQRAGICKAGSAKFEVLDVRKLNQKSELRGSVDVALCLECIEHIYDDRQLMIDISKTLKPGGYLLLTTPYLRFREIDRSNLGPWTHTEDGAHVRRGYTVEMLRELCHEAGLILEHQTFCGGFISQKICRLQRLLHPINPGMAWVAILPLRLLPPIFDRAVSRMTGYPYYSICIEAYKPRFP